MYQADKASNGERGRRENYRGRRGWRRRAVEKLGTTRVGDGRGGWDPLKNYNRPPSEKKRNKSEHLAEKHNK